VTSSWFFIRQLFFESV